MKKTIKKLWLAALRSGEYAQARGALCKSGKKGDSFCCLGVLTELAIQAGVIDGWEATGRGTKLGVENECASYGDRFEVDGLLPKVQKWAGLTDAFPGIFIDDKSLTLADLNDGQKDERKRVVERPRSFEEIADAIEASL